MSKFDSLTNFLLGQPPGPVTMTFTQVNTLLGFCIPAAARKYQVWWANETDQNTRHRQCRSCLNANRKASADLKHGVAPLLPSIVIDFPFLLPNGGHSLLDRLERLSGKAGEDRC